VRFWDSSAIVPLLVDEPAHAAAAHEFGRDPDVLAWWATPVECVSALARLERDGALTADGVRDSLTRLDALAAAWHEIQPVAPIRQRAIRLLRVHPLRAADALQLGAALVAAEDQPSSLPFITFDERLALAAEREGFVVVQPTP
jgi:predicted nucleic acid-binding protein